MDTQVTENVTQVFIAELQRTRQQLTDKPTRKRTKKVNVAPGKAITVADLQNNLNAAEPSTSVRTETSHCKKKQDTTAPRKRRRRNSETSDEEELSEGGKLYPGLVMSNDEKHEETEISAMKKRGKFWTWPNPPDVVWYRKNQIKGPLNPPQKIGDNLYQTNLKS
ncbi:hypothetical protein QE152_g18095 [Popillia japonica]|uniref:Uncharacterized protein n=1 Tax=Popillia japonica TaxID=7064 RepID=A0AAW1L4F2_POPJA